MRSSSAASRSRYWPQLLDQALCGLRSLMCVRSPPSGHFSFDSSIRSIFFVAITPPHIRRDTDRFRSSLLYACRRENLQAICGSSEQWRPRFDSFSKNGRLSLFCQPASRRKLLDLLRSVARFEIWLSYSLSKKHLLFQIRNVERVAFFVKQRRVVLNAAPRHSRILRI